MHPRVLPSGDAALVVEFGDAVDPAVSARVTRLADAVAAAAVKGVVELVPTFRSLLVCYDPLATTHAELAPRVLALDGEAAGESAAARLWTLPTSYAPEHAPDLAEVAARAGLPADEVVRLHAGETYRVYMLGFLPGYAYMGDLPAPLRGPRRQTPRVTLPAGSVAIAMQMTAVYPVESPGGWNLIGKCPIRLFDLATDPPSLFAPGDRVRFRPVGRDEWAAVAAGVADGTFRLAPESLP